MLRPLPILIFMSPYYLKLLQVTMIGVKWSIIENIVNFKFVQVSS